MPQPLIHADQLDVVSIDMSQTGRQVQAVYGTIAAANGTTTIPFDTTIPLITEGTNIGTGIITPQAVGSDVLIQFSVSLDASANGTDVVVAVFNGNTCIASSVVTIDTTGKPKTMSLSFADSPATTSAVTYTGRMGVATAGPTWYVNSNSAGNDLGGTLVTSFVLTELSG